jgi:hypothetical protein
MRDEETEPIWCTWSNGDSSRLYVTYPKDLKDKPDELAKFLEKEWFVYPCKVSYRGIHKAKGFIPLPELKAFFIDLRVVVLRR